MGLQIGIVGLPNVGKSTLFNALTRTQGAQAANYPFCTIDPNVGIVEVPDQRLHKLTEMVNPEKKIPAIVEFVDIAGLVKGASQGEGLGNQFLANIRECNAIAHVVRFFEDGNITHVSETIDPGRDIEVIETELVLADLQTLEKRIPKVATQAKSGDKKIKALLTLLERINQKLQEGVKLIDQNLTAEEQELIRDLHLITGKPIIYIANVHENDLKDVQSKNLHEHFKLPSHAKIIPISAKVEEDLMGFSNTEAVEFLQELGLAESGLNSLIRHAYDILGLQTFFTAGPKEVRAWTVKKGATAPEAAGVIHTDFQKGFIKAEVMDYDHFIEAGSELKAKELGKMRQEGKEYFVKDGDIMHFRFNV